MSGSRLYGPETDPDRLVAIHEGGHAVEAYLGGLGVLWARLDPGPDVRTVEQDRLEASIPRLLDPPLPLSDDLLRFYVADIRLRVSGGLARFRFEEPRHVWSEAEAQSLDLSKYGGQEDQAVAETEADVLRRGGQRLRPVAYVAWAKGKVWRDTLERVALITVVADALVERRSLDGPEIEALLSQLLSQEAAEDLETKKPRRL